MTSINSRIDSSIEAAKRDCDRAIANLSTAVQSAESDLRNAGWAIGFQLSNLRSQLNGLVTGDAIRDKINQAFANYSSLVESTVDRLIQKTAWQDDAAAEQECTKVVSEYIASSLRIYFPQVNW